MSKKVRRRKILRKKSTQPVAWLPIDSRFLPDIIRFGHVKGIARLFLIVEIFLAVLVVIGTLSLVFLKAIGLTA
jgi:hypothetical protein